MDLKTETVRKITTDIYALTNKSYALFELKK